jgi:hypothetical protein
MVEEPYAIGQKFPHPMIHVHYARGCSLAEAFYQSVYSPYQMLLVGDPLCQPWANLPVVSVEGLSATETVKGRVYLRPWARSSAGHVARRFEIFLDGRLAARCDPGGSADFDSERLPDGYHELRVVAIMDTPIETQGRIIVPFFANNRGRVIDCHAAPPRTVLPGQRLTITAKSPGSTAVLVFHNRREVARMGGEQGQTEIDAGQLGSGPVVLQAVGIVDGPRLNYVFSDPLQLDIQE